MASGPVVAIVIEGLDAVKTGRAMLGATNPLESGPGECRWPIDLRVCVVDFSFTQVLSVATMRFPLVATSVTAATLSQALRRKSSCKAKSFH